MFQPLKGHLQGVKWIHSSSLVTKMNHQLQNTTYCVMCAVLHSSCCVAQSYLSHVMAAARKPDEYWHCHRSDCRNTLLYVHTTLHTLKSTLPMLPVPEARNIVELILLCICRTREFKQRSGWSEPTACGQAYVMTHAVDTVFSLAGEA
jgi:hypothetical protein